MSIFKTFANLFLASLVLMSFSCEKEEEKKIGGDNDQPLDSGDIKVDGYWFIIENPSNPGQPIDTFKYGSFDTETANYDTIRLEREINSDKDFNAFIRFYDGSNDVTQQIRNNGYDYIVCYRDMDTDELRLNDRDLDVNDKILGLESEWSTVGGINQNVVGTVRITLNYQVNKESLCDAGVRIFNATVPYKLY